MKTIKLAYGNVEVTDSILVGFLINLWGMQAMFNTFQNDDYLESVQELVEEGYEEDFIDFMKEYDFM